MVAVLRVKHSFSGQHLVAAKEFVRLCACGELKAVGASEESCEHRAYATGAVVFSVAFLEASINELYLEAIDGNRQRLEGLSEAQVATLAELWEVIERASVLSKYQVALAACGAERFDEGAEPLQGTHALVKVRDALIHYRPEWDDELKVHKAIEDRLRGRFALNPLAKPDALWFPHQCLGAGCAKWSVEQAESFMRGFCERLGIPSRIR